MRTPSPRLVEEILRHGAKAIGVSAEVCERQYIPVPDDFDSGRIERALAKAAPQLGSVGGGNHFVELQCDRDTGEVWVMVHCGSRGFGWQTADWFFKAGAELRGLPAGRRVEAWLRVDEPLGRQYCAHHNAARHGQQGHPRLRPRVPRSLHRLDPLFRHVAAEREIP
jgi:tRNA-splicing ligase RtcB